MAENDVEMLPADGNEVPALDPEPEPVGKPTVTVDPNDPLTGEFTWRVENFSQLPDKETSPIFEVGGYQWSLLLFPHGNNKESGKFVSAYLAMASSEEADSTRFTAFDLLVVNQDDPEKTFYKNSKHTFCPRENDWGFAQLLPIEKLDPSKGYLVDDTLIIQVKLSVRDLEETFDQDSRAKTGFVGLKNQGATCYMNSLLQTLFNVNQFRKAVYHMPTTEDEEPSGSMSLALQSVFYKLQFTQGPVSTEDLTKAFGWDSVDAFQQHDVQELKALLSDRLEEKMKGTRVEGAVNRLFEGHTWNYIDCINIDFKSTRREAFQDLQLDVKGCGTIYNSLDKFCEVETLDGDNCYEAEGHGKQPARRGVLFDSLPPVLSLHLKRFEYDWQRDAMIKINDRHEFYDELDLDKVGEDGKPLYLSPNMDGSIQNKYKLLAVLVHTGNLHGGHYYAYVRPNGTQWLKFDDETVTLAKEEDAVQQNWGGDGSAVVPVGGFVPRMSSRFSNAYMLVYVRESEWDAVMCDVTEEDIAAHVRARLVAEEAEAERTKREKAEAHLFAMVRVATDKDIKKNVGEKRQFDLVDFRNDDLDLNLKLRKNQPFSEVQRSVQERTGVPPELQRFRTWILRRNATSRAAEPLPIESPDQTIASLLSKTGIRAGPKQGKYAEMNLYLEPMKPETIQQGGLMVDKSTRLIFFKHYIPATATTPAQLNYAGHAVLPGTARIEQLLPFLRRRGELAEDTDIVVYEEVKFEPQVMVDKLEFENTLNEAQLEDGDILIFQRNFTTEEEAEAEILHPTVDTYLEYVRNCAIVEFIALENGHVADANKHPSFKLSLLWDMTWNDVSSAVATHLNLDHPLKLRFTMQSKFNASPATHPLIYNATFTLERMLFSFGARAPTVAASRGNLVLYYEMIDLPLPEYERLVTHRINVHNAKHEDVTLVEVRLPHERTVGELLEEVRAGMPDALREQVGDAPLRLMEVYHWKIWQLFDPEEQVGKHLGPNSSTWHLRAEVVPEDQRQLTEEGSLHVQCLQVEDKDGNDRIAFPFSDPFIMSIGTKETVGELKERVRREMEVSEEDWENWKVVLVGGGGGLSTLAMEPLEDDVVVAARINPADLSHQCVYGHIDRPCIGFHHENKNQRRTHAHINFNRSAFTATERALKIKG